jgi:hypothetical protein
MTRRRGGLGRAIVSPSRSVVVAATPIPATITGLRTWGIASAYAGAADSAVGTLADSSGNAYTFTAAGGEEPTYKTNIANGQPSLLFAGAHRIRNANVPAQGTGPFSFYIVVKPTGPSGYQNLWTLGTADVAKACFAVMNGSTLEWGLYGGAFHETGTTLATNGIHVVLCRYDGTTCYSYVNGSATADPSAASPAFNLDTNGLSIGAGTGFTQYFTGHVLEWAMYDGCITADDVTTIQTYAAARYGI